MAFVKIEETDGTLSYEVPGTPLRFNVPGIGKEHIDAEAVMEADRAFENLAAFVAEKEPTIINDLSLSEIGRDQKLAPLRSHILESVATAAGNIDASERRVNDVEASFLHVPSLDPAAAAVAIEDREVRDWWRAQPAQTRMDILQRMAEEKGQGAGQDRMMIALMRSPVPQLDHEVKLVRGVWDDSRRAADPAKAVLIANWRRQIDYARRVLAHTAGQALGAAKWQRTQVLEMLVQHPNPATRAGYGVFGFNAHDVEHTRARLRISN